VTLQTRHSLFQWLDYIESLHTQTIDMGLERVGIVSKRLGVHFDCPVIIVGGTNGKGSTCTMLQSILMRAGYRVGLYTSPHIHHFNERACINGDELPDEAFLSGFNAVETARRTTELTYFEFTTLAILYQFANAGLDAVILEVGLGGRLDAVNVIDADVAIVTNIGIDHTDYLGDTRELIGHEKAGIYRSGRTAICGDPEPPDSLLSHAEEIGCNLRLLGRDFSYAAGEKTWRYEGHGDWHLQLDYPSLQGVNQIGNASLSLAALEALRQRLPVDAQAIRDGLRLAYLPGRFQILPGRPQIILDVAHNPHAAAVLADNLGRMPSGGSVHAVFGAMADKDIEGIVQIMDKSVDYWYITDLPVARAASAEHIREILQKVIDAGSGKWLQIYTSPAAALSAAKNRTAENDKIVAFGSFWTVAGVTQRDDAEFGKRSA